MSSSRPPMLINLPPPPSDPITPNEHGPGTPNSTTTSLSALSVVAIKDGSIGHGGRAAAQSANTLEAERADRISRLAGLERVSTVRTNASGQNMPGVGAQGDGGVPMFKARSTVGSASATGSVGGRTTWASESLDYDPDKMSEDQDDRTSSEGGLSDEDKASLVGFGEGANSTISGPVSTANARMIAARHNMMNQSFKSGLQSPGSGQSTPMSGIISNGPASTAEQRMMDGPSYDINMTDAASQTPQLAGQARDTNRLSGPGVDTTEPNTQDVLNDIEPVPHTTHAAGTPSLGSFPFEKDGK